jgi:hypothetical protein
MDVLKEVLKEVKKDMSSIQDLIEKTPIFEVIVFCFILWDSFFKLLGVDTTDEWKL